MLTTEREWGGGARDVLIYRGKCGADRTTVWVVMGGAEQQKVAVHGRWCCVELTTINKQLMNNSAGLHTHILIMIFTKQPSATPLAMEATHGCASQFIGHSI